MSWCTFTLALVSYPSIIVMVGACLALSELVVGACFVLSELVHIYFGIGI